MAPNVSYLRRPTSTLLLRTKLFDESKRGGRIIPQNVSAPTSSSFPGEQPPRAQVEEQLKRLLVSESFAGAIRSQGFLRFIVEETLAGRQDRLHGYTIGVHALGRSEDFDPQADPIVRVEAGRLRRRLERHYLTEGVDDPVLIEVPKGGYVPEFSYRISILQSAEPREESELETSVESPRRHRRNRTVIAALGVVAIFALFFGSRMLFRGENDVTSVGGLPVVREGPIRTVVMPFSYQTTTETHPFLTSGLVEELIAMLAALPGVEVIALGSAAQAAADELTPKEIAQTLKVDYLIQGDVRQERDRVRVNVKVIETSSSLVQLANRYDGTIENILDLQMEVARDLADALAETVTPELDRQLRATGLRDPEALALYYQASTLRDPPTDPVRSRLAEEAYRRVIELDPEFAGGYAGLAYVLSARSWWALSEHPEIDAVEALDAARSAVEKDPNFGWAQATLAFALNVNGDHDGSLQAARSAARLSPGNPHTLALSGLFQAYAGEVEAGIPLARSAIRLDPLSIRTPYRNMAGVILFHAGRFEEAFEILSENVRLGGPDGPHMAYYRAGTLARLGRIEEARHELGRASTFPYEIDIMDFLSAFRDPREADELLDSLESLGFDREAVSASGAP